jgi:hypothetical protein
MKTPFILLLLLFFLNANAQVSTILKRANRTEITSYFEVKEEALKSNEYRVLLHMSYGGSKIKNPDDALRLYTGEIESISLYYSTRISRRLKPLPLLGKWSSKRNVPARRKPPNCFMALR